MKSVNKIHFGLISYICHRSKHTRHLPHTYRLRLIKLNGAINIKATFII